MFSCSAIKAQVPTVSGTHPGGRTTLGFRVVGRRPQTTIQGHAFKQVHGLPLAPPGQGRLEAGLVEEMVGIVALAKFS